MASYTKILVTGESASDLVCQGSLWPLSQWNEHLQPLSPLLAI